MKSEFILAFNEICESRGLHKEEVFEALKNALVSAYRRDNNVSSMQNITVDIDRRTGEPTIYAEKEVVEDAVIDGRTEVRLEDARKEHPDAQPGDLVMIDSTTAGFGRIAAQTAKQVLLQRVREAEREQLYEEFSDREGELVNGTVQSVSGQNLTIGLGRTEALLPKSQQVQGERYRTHDKIRVYVLEVRRTNRGPQIFVSRNHRNLLRRLLELEVPEIYNGQVDIKSIAREAGQRSKVAVQALQPGVDPVGACVGMRGVRIQSIVRELNDEKIDVIEWDPDHKVFIAKALSPARVSHVFLDDNPDEGKTAVVIVPDDQLSLAIGREGQNARLAAKLTGWRIDIKSLTEAARDSLDNLDHPAADPAVARNEELLEKVRFILEKKEANRPITSEDYYILDRLVSGVEGRIIAENMAAREGLRLRRAEARKAVPEIAWSLDLEELDLPGRIHNLLLDNRVETVGAVLMVLNMGDDVFLGFKGLGEKALETVKEAIANLEILEETAVEAEELAEEAAEELVEAEIEAEAAAEELEVEAEAVEETAVAEAEVIEAEAEAEAVEEEAEVEPVDIIDDLSKPLVSKEPKKDTKK
ncbi:MAG TPA: transcription termination/antitermination protein NusA, partial [Anaerolineae bacterium]|nr:transcription termination/antitermination protein NusA [Anaerolineae bacterium]